MLRNSENSDEDNVNIEKFDQNSNYFLYKYKYFSHKH